ncbi:rhs core protein [Escherichia coli]|uniref:rhs core protein n=1 Tax=Escherichia coli TaxID=562 RepID=UPI002E134952
MREILISESAWEEMTCLFAPSLYIEKELFIKRTTENDCRALVLRGTLEYLFDEIIAGECALALLQKEIKKD